MLRRIVSYVGRAILRVATATLVFAGLLWAAGSLVGFEPGLRVSAWGSSRLHVFADKTNDWVEGFAGRHWDEQTLLRWRTQRTISMLEREIARLQWIEAESLTQAGNANSEVLELTQNMEDTRASLLEMANLMKMSPGVIYVDGLPYRGAQIESIAAQKMLEFTTLQEQVDLYHSARATHQNTAINARILWVEAAQNIKTLEAHIALLEATTAYDQVRHPGGQGETSAYELSAQLRDQLERNRKIIERRRQLEGGIAPDQDEIPPLDILLTQSELLADAIGGVSTGTSNE